MLLLLKPVDSSTPSAHPAILHGSTCCGLAHACLALVIALLWLLTVAWAHLLSCLKVMYLKWRSHDNQCEHTSSTCFGCALAILSTAVIGGTGSVLLLLKHYDSNNPLHAPQSSMAAPAVAMCVLAWLWP